MRLPFNLPLVLTVLFWAFNFVALKLVYEQIEPPAVALIRFLLMYACMLLICALTGERLRMHRPDALKVHFFGFMSMGVYMVLFLEGMRESAPAEAAILLNTSPIITILLSAAINRERPRLGSLAGAVLAFAGVVMVVLAGAARGTGTLLGNALILASAATWAYCVVLMQPLLRRHSPTSLLTLSMPAGLLLLVPYGLLATLRVPFAEVTPHTWLMFLHVTVLSGVAAFICFYAGVRAVGGASAMLYMYFVPPGAALFAWLFLGSTLAPIQLVGLVVVILGVAIAQLSMPSEQRSRPSIGSQAQASEGTI